MPPFDENGNMIGMDDFPIFLRGDDAVEHVLPSSIPEISADDINDPELEHDYLPPLETPLDATWTLSEEASKRLLELIDRDEALTKMSIHEYLQKLSDELGATMEERDPPARKLRKRIRWDERNRRRKLKGLPEKNNPHYGDMYFVITVPVHYPVETCHITIDGLTKEQAEDMERIVKNYDAE
jgi:hypothetical protein